MIDQSTPTANAPEDKALASSVGSALQRKITATIEVRPYVSARTNPEDVADKTKRNLSEWLHRHSPDIQAVVGSLDDIEIKVVIGYDE